MAESWNVGGFLNNLKGFGNLIEAEAEKAVADIAEYVLGEAVSQVPFEDGDLASSGKVSVDKSTRTAAVSFDTPYAVRQHEDMTAKHDAGRKAKYLEDPMNAAAQGPAQAIIKMHLGKAF